MGKLARFGKMNSKGLTLVEILAALALLSIVITLSISMVMVGKSTVDRQNTKADMQDAVTLAMKDITKQIRSATKVTLEKNNSVLRTDAYVYRFSNQKIYKNDIVLVENIGALTFSKEESLVSVRVESIDKEVSLFSEILIRE